MPPRRTVREDEERPAKLSIPRVEAEKQLAERIKKGQDLCNLPIANPDELKTARGTYYTWDEYNYTLLSRIFDSTSVAKEYRGISFGGPDEHDFPASRQYFLESCDYEIRKLSSIAERLPLYDAPTIAARPLSPDATRTNWRPDGPAAPSEPRKIFVVHGRDESTRASMFAFLRAIDLRPIEWAEAVAATGKGSPYIGEVLDAAFSIAGAVLVLSTPDDEARLRPALTGPEDSPSDTEFYFQARANVIFEAGMAMARDEIRTILVEVGGPRSFSDIAGRHAIRLDGSPEKLNELIARLRTAGCPVDATGSEWMKVGRQIVVAQKEPLDGTTKQVGASRPIAGGAAAQGEPATSVPVKSKEDPELAYRPRLSIQRQIVHLSHDSRKWVFEVSNIGAGPAIRCRLGWHEFVPPPGSGHLWWASPTFDLGARQSVTIDQDDNLFMWHQQVLHGLVMGPETVLAAACEDLAGNRLRFVIGRAKPDIWRAGEPESGWERWGQG